MIKYLGEISWFRVQGWGEHEKLKSLDSAAVLEEIQHQREHQRLLLPHANTHGKTSDVPAGLLQTHSTQLSLPLLPSNSCVILGGNLCQTLPPVLWPRWKQLSCASLDVSAAHLSKQLSAQCHVSAAHRGGVHPTLCS